jgi:hypothetical protein
LRLSQAKVRSTTQRRGIPHSAASASIARMSWSGAIPTRPTPTLASACTPIHVAAHALLCHALRQSRRCSSPPPCDKLAGFGLFCRATQLFAGAVVRLMSARPDPD